LAKRPAPPDDLGPVRFSVSTEYGPRDVRLQADESMGGPLAALQTSHAATYKGKWTVHFGHVPLQLKTHVHADAIEELFIFLIELVDAGFGEWTVRDKSQTLVIEAQVYGPDADLEFGDGEGGPPSFKRVQFPKRAKVRLRALVEECARFLRRLLVDVTVADPTFAGADEVRADLDALVEAVAALPLEFRAKDGS